ncbi:MAG: hypothetical protein U0414_06360 [Polyangiaceae bacterium]
MASLRFGGSLALVVACTASCLPRAGTDVGNGLTVKLNLQLAPELAATTESKKVLLADGAILDQLWVATAKYRLTPGANCSEPDPRIDIPGPAFADLLGVGFVDGAKTFPTDGNTFCKLSFSFHEAAADALPAGVPLELGGASLFLRGHRADGVVFTVRSTMKDTLKLDATDGSFELRGTDPALIVAFDLDAATAALELEALSGNPITIDDKTNPSALKAFDAALRKSAKLFDDEDKNGELSAGETDDEHKLGEGGQ